MTHCDTRLLPHLGLHLLQDAGDRWCQVLEEVPEQLSLLPVAVLHRHIIAALPEVGLAVAGALAHCALRCKLLVVAAVPRRDAAITERRPT